MAGDQTPDARPDQGGLSRRGLLRRGAVASAGIAVGATAVAGLSTDAAAAPVADDPAARAPMRATAAGATLIEVTLVVNGRSTALRIDPRVTLLDALREQLGLTGTKKGCDHGQCGACTVLVDDPSAAGRAPAADPSQPAGRRVLACLTLAGSVNGQRVTTIEGLAQGDTLHPVQQAFLDHDALQCGFCTPGQIMSAVALLGEGAARTPSEIREWMSGNLCRCGAYGNIVDAVNSTLNAGKAVL